MKKIFNLFIATVALFTVASCSDVPNPYELLVSDPSTGKTLPYKSSSLSSGFSVQTIAGNAWSQGSSYTQASGWSNNTATESESWLVSPGIKTEADSTVLSFDYTIRYGNSLTEADILAFHKVYISLDYNDDVTTASWTELPFAASKSTYSDWTLYPSGDIQIPDSFLNRDKVFVAFVYKCGNTQAKITTWELMNFSMKKGVAEGSTVPTPQTGSLPYTSANLNSGWITNAPADANPWSQGSSYVQATGYQKWDGADTKSNKEVSGYLISPKLNTTVPSGKVKFSFDHTIRYANNVSGWEGYHKLYVSDNYDEKNFDAATWKEIKWTPLASSYSDWTLYSSGEIQLPDEYVNKENVHIAFYFYAPATASTTWEMKNFSILEGEAQNAPTPEPPSTSDASQDFTQGQGSYNVFDVEKGSMNYVWQQSASYGMKASAYYNSANVAAESWLISPAFEVSETTMTIVNALNYLKTGNLADHIGVYVSENYTAGSPSSATWKNLTITTPPSGSSWDWVNSTVDLSSYKGKKVTVAFKYVSTSEIAPTWEIKSVSCSAAPTGGGEGPNPPATGAGSKTEPYSCAAAQQAGVSTTPVWVKGYIVGYIDGTSIASGAKFAIPAAAETEVLIADDPSTTDYTKCVPVQLPSGVIRTGLELFAHQSYYKQEVLVYGTLATYFGVLGVKSPTCAIINNTTIGTDPTAK